MLRSTLVLLLVAGALSATPSFADTKSGGGTIGRGCTLNPFNHTMRCIDFDHCTTDKNGNKTCPVVVTPTRATFAENKGKTGNKGGKHETQDYLVVTLTDASIMAYD
jgi:hypothetical protein